MFPTISHLIDYLTGIYIPLPIQTFGFMMTLSFIAAAYTLYCELKRKEGMGLIQPHIRTHIKGKPANVQELIFSFLWGFILGYKLPYILLEYNQFSNNPQEFILSNKGNLIGGLIGGGIIAGLKYWEKKKHQLPQPQEEKETVYPHKMVGDITIVAAMSGLLGAKIFDNLEHWNDFIQDPIGALFSFSGLTFYGGLIFGSVAVLYYATKLGIRYYYMIDAAAPGLILAYAIGRGGCHLSGDGDWGIVNTSIKPSWISFIPDWAWSYTYPHNVLSEGVPIPGCEGRFCFQLPEPVYPTPLYEIIWASLIFLILWNIRKRINIPGILFSIYLVLNGMERFTIEIIRVNPQYEVLGIALSQAQLIALGLILSGCVGIWFFYTKRHQHLGNPVK